MNPDEVVAIGAAIQGGVLKGDVKDVLLLDVSPLTLAIETAGGVATPMIPRNTTVPDPQVADLLDLQRQSAGCRNQGAPGRASALSRDNKNLGTFHLDGIPPSPRGTPQIEVTFDIDANGILNVSAKDLGTGKEQKISITGSSGLTKEEIARMQKEAEAHADEDNKAKEAIETRNRADNLAYQSEKQLKDLGDKLPADKKTGIESAIADVRKALEGTDTDAIKSAAGHAGNPLPGSQRRALPARRRPASSRLRARRLRRGNPAAGRRPAAVAARSRKATWSTPSSRWSTKTRRSNRLAPRY